MAAVGSNAPVAASVTRLAAVCRATGSALADVSVIGASGRCGAEAAWATIPLVSAKAMTTPSSRFVMLMTIWIASSSAYGLVVVATFLRTLRHRSPAVRGGPLIGAHRPFTAPTSPYVVFFHAAPRIRVSRSAGPTGRG